MSAGSGLGEEVGHYFGLLQPIFFLFRSVIIYVAFYFNFIPYLFTETALKAENPGKTVDEYLTENAEGYVLFQKISILPHRGFFWFEPLTPLEIPV